jgi:hypothetical protein
MRDRTVALVLFVVLLSVTPRLHAALGLVALGGLVVAGVMLAYAARSLWKPIAFMAGAGGVLYHIWTRPTFRQAPLSDTEALAWLVALGGLTVGAVVAARIQMRRTKV